MKKTHKAPRQAIALNYDGQSAPTLSAKGDAELAEAILAIAREHEVPIYENGELVRLLARLELGEAIPQALYRTMAEIIAFAWYLKGKSPAPRANANSEQLLLEGPGLTPASPASH
ncbi:EscU/YscU/HrcU family type III secretion system export apparatus switch protein [Pseudomonas panipatensis]|uniref:EscU/YscU/HrcU family type III secretion system export apparatus switch protein n=1 Tax=Pseudomonas panipatensis TaxID=428992 RepID=UPI0035AEF202